MPSKTIHICNTVEELVIYNLDNNTELNGATKKFISEYGIDGELNLVNCKGCFNCADCTNCMYCTECVGCHACIACVNLLDFEDCTDNVSNDSGKSVYDSVLN